MYHIYKTSVLQKLESTRLGLSKRGFTLIELIVVFSIITVLSTIGIASFVTYSRQESVQTAASEVKTMLAKAKSFTLSQVKPSQCNDTQQFNGYRVLFCCNTGNLCPQPCQGNGDYELQVVCAAVPVMIESKKLPANVSIDTNSSNTTSRSYAFQPISGGVIGNGKVTVKGYTSSQTISVSSTGIIQ